MYLCCVCDRQACWEHTQERQERRVVLVACAEPGGMMGRLALKVAHGLHSLVYMHTAQARPRPGQARPGAE